MVDRALWMSAVDELVEATLLVANAGADFGDATGVGFARPIGIGQERAREHHHIARAVSQRTLRHVGIAQLAHGNDGNVETGVGFDVVFREVRFHELRHG